MVLVARMMTAGVAAATCLFSAVGCNRTTTAEYDAVLMENEELRGQIASLQDQVDTCDGDRSSLQRENDELIAALNESRSQVLTAPAAYQSADSSGFMWSALSSRIQ